MFGLVFGIWLDLGWGGILCQGGGAASLPIVGDERGGVAAPFVSFCFFVGGTRLVIRLSYHSVSLYILTTSTVFSI